jgi:uncharacterized membrane protein
MQENDPLELKIIRELQQDLHGRINALDGRIELFEKNAEFQLLEQKKEESPILEALECPMPPIVVPPPLPPVVWKEEIQESPATPLPPSPPAQKPASLKKVEVPASDSLELRLGRVWLVRLGIVILLTGLVFLGNYAWNECIARLGAIGKLSLIVLAGLALGGLGDFFKRRREELATYGNVLIGGGIATIYYATYAAHYVEPLRVISSPLLGGALLMGLACGIIWIADRIRSEVVASATILLGFYTAAINPIEGFSLFSNLVLSVMAIILLLRRNWLSPSFLSLIGCYLAFAFWRLHALDSLFVVHAFNKQLFWTAFSFPASYWAVFTAATFLARSETFANGNRSVFLTMNNGAFFALTSTLIAGTYPSQLWFFALGYGVLLLLLALLAAKATASETSFDRAYLMQGLVLLFAALLFKLSGYQLAFAFALQSATLLKLGQYRYRKILEIFSGISALIAAFFALTGLIGHAPHHLVTASGAALILTGTAWLFKSQKNLLSSISFQWKAMAYIALAMLLGVVTILTASQGSENSSLYELLALALLSTVSIYLLRMPEVMFGAQGVAAIALIQWFTQSQQSHEPPSLSIMTLSLLGLMHWWQSQKFLPHSRQSSLRWQGLYSVSLVAVIYVWMTFRISPEAEMLAMAASGLILLIYALLTRAWPLACASQFFSLVTLGHLSVALSEHAAWQSVVSTLVLFTAQILVLELLNARIPDASRTLVSAYKRIVLASSLILGIVAIEIYVPEFLITITWSLLAFIVLGTGFLLRERVYRLLGLLLLSISIARLFFVDVWHLETIYRILSFLILGVVMLALGFLYNRFADFIRKWI